MRIFLSNIFNFIGLLAVAYMFWHDYEWHKIFAVGAFFFAIDALLDALFGKLPEEKEVYEYRFIPDEVKDDSKQKDEST